MKLINPKAEVLIQSPGLDGIYKQIEIAGRTCYKSEDKITEASSVDFVRRMIESHHTAMLEHGTVYLKLPPVIDPMTVSRTFDYMHNPYSKVVCNGYDADYVTTNLRVLQDNNWLENLRYLCEPTNLHKKRITVRFITDRGISHELIRHRVFSFAQESTRYCNYTKDKFGNELTFIIPRWAENIKEGHYDDTLGLDWFWHNSDGGESMRCNDREMCLMGVLNKSETCYMDAISRGCTPQEARQMLPNAIKTEIVMTGFASDWRHFFDLRYFGKTGKPHPDMEYLATLAKEALEKEGLWEEIMAQPSKFN